MLYLRRLAAAGRFAAPRAAFPPLRVPDRPPAARAGAADFAGRFAAVEREGDERFAAGVALRRAAPVDAAGRVFGGAAFCVAAFGGAAFGRAASDLGRAVSTFGRAAGSGGRAAFAAGAGTATAPGADAADAAGAAGVLFGRPLRRAALPAASIASKASFASAIRAACGDVRSRRARSFSAW
jgi:hypothetical protein